MTKQEYVTMINLQKLDEIEALTVQDKAVLERLEDKYYFLEEGFILSSSYHSNETIEEIMKAYSAVLLNQERFNEAYRVLDNIELVKLKVG